MRTQEGKESSKRSHYFEIACFLAVAIVLIFPFKKFVLDRDFFYVVEVPCDPQKETCLYRDCSTDECPPNQLNDYKRYKISARDFSICRSESCYLECEARKIMCEPEE